MFVSCQYSLEQLKILIKQVQEAFEKKEVEIRAWKVSIHRHASLYSELTWCGLNRRAVLIALPVRHVTDVDFWRSWNRKSTTSEHRQPRRSVHRHRRLSNSRVGVRRQQQRQPIVASLPKVPEDVKYVPTVSVAVALPVQKKTHKCRANHPYVSVARVYSL